MANTLTVTSKGKGGLDLAEMQQLLADGLYSMDASGTDLTAPEGTALFSMDAGTTELRIDFTTIGGEIHATSFTYTDDDGATVTGSFADPEPLGFTTWSSTSSSLYEALFGDTRIDLRGTSGDDAAYGTALGDRFKLGGGDDAAAGGAGNDILLGGRGNDLLNGGADDDRINGGADDDLLISGAGNDVVDGGSGNDVLILGAGQNVATGGRGVDVFVFDSFSSQAGGSPNVQTRVTDFTADDILIFTEVQTSAGGNPEGFTAASTLADLENGTVDAFVWAESAQGVRILSGEHQVLLEGVTAEEVLLSQLGFGVLDSGDIAGAFDGAASADTLAQNPLGDAFIAYGSESSTFIAYGEETSTFIGFGEDGFDFV